MPEPNRLTPLKNFLTSPSRLYTRGNFYYFRVVLPTLEVGDSMRRKIRLSLRTGYRQQAKKLAQELFAHLRGLLRDDPMIDYLEIKRRMNLYLRKMLEIDHNALPTKVSRQDSPHFLPKGEIGLYYANQMLQGLDNPDKLSELAEKIIPILVDEGFIKAEEVADGNRLALAKEFAKTYISYLKILERREKGDFLAEAPVFAYDSQAPVSTPVTADIQTKEPLSPNISKVMEKYIETKISDGHWRPQTVTDHKNRLANFLEIASDKPLKDIMRDDVRAFRDNLRKLPPNRGRSAKYKGKSVPELLAMKLPPEEVLNVKSVNVIIGELASFFEWCVRESLIPSNPATLLQIKDDRQAIELRDAFTMDDLRLIFSHLKFAEGKFKFPAYFWIALIALFTGMHLSRLRREKNIF